MKKICYNCKQEKELSEFSLDKRSKDKLQGICKICQKEYRKKHYLENKEDYLERTKKQERKEMKKESYIKVLKVVKYVEKLDGGF